jgi:MYND finger
MDISLQESTLRDTLLRLATMELLNPQRGVGCVYARAVVGLDRLQYAARNAPSVRLASKADAEDVWNRVGAPPLSLETEADMSSFDDAWEGNELRPGTCADPWRFFLIFICVRDARLVRYAWFCTETASGGLCVVEKTIAAHPFANAQRRETSWHLRNVMCSAAKVLHALVRDNTYERLRVFDPLMLYIVTRETGGTRMLACVCKSSGELCFCLELISIYDEPGTCIVDAAFESCSPSPFVRALAAEEWRDYAANTGTCAACARTCRRRRCAACRSVMYCDEACQKAHWGVHAEVCLS